MFKFKTKEVHQLKKITEVLKDMFNNIIIRANEHGIEIVQNHKDLYMVLVTLKSEDYTFTSTFQDDVPKHEWQGYFKSTILYKLIKTMTSVEALTLENTALGLLASSNEYKIQSNMKSLNMTHTQSGFVMPTDKRHSVIVDSKLFSKCLRDIKSSQFETITFTLDAGRLRVGSQNTLHDYTIELPVSHVSDNTIKLSATQKIEVLMLYVKSVSLHKSMIIHFYEKYMIFQHLLCSQTSRTGKISFISKNSGTTGQ